MEEEICRGKNFKQLLITLNLHERVSQHVEHLKIFVQQIPKISDVCARIDIAAAEFHLYVVYSRLREHSFGTFKHAELVPLNVHF